MNEAETRAEHIDPALKAAGWGVVEGSRILREYHITQGRLEGHGRRAKGSGGVRLHQRHRGSRIALRLRQERVAAASAQGRGIPVRGAGAAFRCPAYNEYGDIRAELEAAGRAVGSNDLLIAAHARALAATMVTANVGEFRRVPGLNVENWLE